MDAHTLGVMLVGGAGLALVVWVLHKIGKVLVAVAEAVATVAVVFMALWLVVKGVAWLIKQIVTHPRTTATLTALLAWWHWLGWPSLAITAGSVTVVLTVWRLVDVVSFDRWAGRRLRAWWQRWTVYAPKLPVWLHACGLSMTDDSMPVVVTVNLVGRRKVRRERQAATVRLPKVVGVKSGPSWDEVRMRLVPGQKPRTSTKRHGRT